MRLYCFYITSHFKSTYLKGKSLHIKIGVLAIKYLKVFVKRKFNLIFIHIFSNILINQVSRN